MLVNGTKSITPPNGTRTPEKNIHPNKKPLLAHEGLSQAELTEALLGIECHRRMFRNLP